jgi:hypothetical protein
MVDGELLTQRAKLGPRPRCHGQSLGRRPDKIRP